MPATARSAAPARSASPPRPATRSTSDMHLQDAQLARSDNISATASGDLAITNNRANGALISGTLNVANLRYEIIRQGAAQVVDLQGVRRKGEPLPSPGQIRLAEADKAPSIWKLDLRVHADNQVFVAGMGLESEWNANLRIRGTTATSAARRPDGGGARHVQLLRATLRPHHRNHQLHRRPAARPAARHPGERRHQRCDGQHQRHRLGQQSADHLHLQSVAAAGRDHGAGAVRRLDQPAVGAAGGVDRLVAQFSARRRRRSQPARQAAPGGRARAASASSAPTRPPAAAPRSPPASTSATKSISS